MQLMKLYFGDHLKSAKTQLSCNIGKPIFLDFPMLQLVRLFLNNSGLFRSFLRLIFLKFNLWWFCLSMWVHLFSGNEDPFSLLRDVIEAEEIKLDRWTVVFRPLSEETTEGLDGKVMVSTTQATEDNAQVKIHSNCQLRNWLFLYYHNSVLANKAHL